MPLRSFVVLSAALTALLLALAACLWAGAGLLTNLHKAAPALPGALVGDVRTSFTAHVERIRATGGDELVVADADLACEYIVEDTRREYWTGLSLGTTRAEVRAPVRFKHYLKLSDPWSLEPQGEVLIVHAPTLRLYQPPTVDVARLEQHLSKGWARLNGPQVQAEAMNGFAANALIQYQQDPDLKVLVRDRAREAVTGFVRAWMVQHAPQHRHIIIRFPDEPAK